MTVDDYLTQRLAELDSSGLYRDPDDGRARDEASAGAAALGRPLLDASSNDYLGLASHGVSRETLSAWAVTTGSGASRLIHGSRPAHSALETEVASWVRLPAALLFSSGYAANVGTLSGVCSRGAFVISDELNHASIIDGCRLSRAEVAVVPHLDIDAVERALAGAQGAAVRWVVAESYFSMDGDGPNLPALRKLCDEYQAGLIVDEAHALGVFGPEGAGRCAEQGVTPDVLIGTFGKAVGVQGAFVAGGASVRRLLWNAARSFVFSTAPSPALSALTLFHVKQVRSANEARHRLLALSEQLRSSLRGVGVATPAGSFGPIVPVVVGNNERALAVAARLRARGILTQAIRPPTVPVGTARLRVTVSGASSSEQIDRLSEELAAAIADGSPPARPPVPQSAIKPRRVVVLGTGTHVGKTYVAAALARCLQSRCVRVRAVKPIETGSDGPIGTDGALLADATGHRPAPNAVVFADPLAPRLAAERAGRKLELAELVQVVSDVERADHTLQCMVIESAGGVFSPITDGASNFELALALDPACWVLVAPDALGVLHDVSAAARAMSLSGRPPDHIVLCSARDRDASSGTNASELAKLGYAPTTVLTRADESGIEALVVALGW